MLKTLSAHDDALIALRVLHIELQCQHLFSCTQSDRRLGRGRWMLGLVWFGLLHAQLMLMPSNLFCSASRKTMNNHNKNKGKTTTTTAATGERTTNKWQIINDKLRSSNNICRGRRRRRRRCGRLAMFVNNVIIQRYVR